MDKYDYKGHIIKFYQVIKHNKKDNEDKLYDTCIAMFFDIELAKDYIDYLYTLESEKEYNFYIKD